MSNIPVYLQSIFLGVLLSDGWLYKNKAGKTLFALKQTKIFFPYGAKHHLWIIYTKFFHYCRSLPIKTKTSIKRNTFFSVMFATRVFPCFTK